VRDIIAGLTGSEPDEAILSWRFAIDEADVTQAVTWLLDAEAELRNATRLRTEARSQALRELADAGLPQSAIGDILGVSHQRVHQLLQAS
jgi:Homeodomain-like domain